MAFYLSIIRFYCIYKQILYTTAFQTDRGKFEITEKRPSTLKFKQRYRYSKSIYSEKKNDFSLSVSILATNSLIVGQVWQYCTWIIFCMHGIYQQKTHSIQKPMRQNNPQNNNTQETTKKSQCKNSNFKTSTGTSAAH